MTDMNRCPQTTDEFRDYLYALIGEQLGDKADDFESVFSTAYPWQGSYLMIPPGVGPGVKQPPDAPFFGLTQQYSGAPKARVFLPAATPDELGYFTRCMQYVDDAAHTLSASKKQPTAQSTGLVWAWYLAGPDNAYVPVLPADGGAVPPTTTGISEEQVQAMIDAAIAPLAARVSTLEDLVSEPLHAHGPVNLPIVVESLTSMRAKGDIDVEVMYGAATPPPDTGGDDVSGAKLLLWLRRRDDTGEQP